MFIVYKFKVIEVKVYSFENDQECNFLFNALSKNDDN